MFLSITTSQIRFLPQYSLYIDHADQTIFFIYTIFIFICSINIKNVRKIRFHEASNNYVIDQM